MRRLDVRQIPERAEVSIAPVIDEDYDDSGSGSLCIEGREKDDAEGENTEDFRNHSVS